eukprot:UN18492
MGLFCVIGGFINMQKGLVLITDIVGENTDDLQTGLTILGCVLGGLWIISSLMKYQQRMNKRTKNLPDFRGSRWIRQKRP